MDKDLIINEASFKAVRSSGAGGQNVNKVASKVILSFNLAESNGLTDEEKAIAEANLAPRLTNEKVLILQCDEDRSQLRNKELVTRRFLQVMENALVVPKERKATKIPKSVIKKRMQAKRRQSDIKQSRKKPDV